MQRIAFVIIFLISLFVQLAAAETIRVRIKHGLNRVSLSGFGLQVAQQKNFQKVAIPQNRKMDILRVKISGKSYWQISQSDFAENQNWMSSQAVLFVQGSDLRLESTELPNKLLIQENKDEIEVIGLVPLEEYVLAVLMNEMPLSWPLETLKAQAVAIRSYAKAVMGERERKTYHVESSVLDQVYKKIQMAEENVLYKKAQQAVKETEGVFLKTPQGEILKAFYHSDCGGRTVPASFVWSQEKGADAGVTQDVSCPYNPKAQWNYEITKEKLAALLGRNLGADFTLEAPIAEGYGRVKEVIFTWPGDVSKRVNANDLRQMLGFQDLRSTAFQVSIDQNSVRFIGQGFGHGVGMCQWGSKTLGLRKYSYQRILRHYYSRGVLALITEN